MLSDLQALGGGIAGFALLRMRDELPIFVGKLFNGLISKFTGNKDNNNTPPPAAMLLLFMLFSFSAFSQVTDAALTTENKYEYPR
jgi:hypothetical protein